MSIHNLDKLFHPRAVAVIGASEREESIGRALMTNLIKGGFAEPIYPIHPQREKILGYPAHPTVLDLAEPIDLAVVATPIASVPEVIDQCVQKRIGGAVIISAGGKETGESGRDLEIQIKEKAHAGSLRLIGPNCLGIICSQSRLNASFAADMAPPGKLAFISQSGAICTAILDLAFQEKTGFSYFISIGSMLDVDFGDLIDYLGRDPKVSSILLYMESLAAHRKFLSAARAVTRIKPIVVLKAGKSAAGAKAAASHTGAMAGEDSVFDAAFKRAGIIRVETITALFDCAELMAKQPRPKGPRLGIITNAGGPGVMAVDALDGYGLAPTPLTFSTLDSLNTILPPFWSHNNPIDILGDASAERYAQTLDICIHSGQFDGLLVILVPQALTDPREVAKQLASMKLSQNFVIVASWMGGRDVAPARDILNQAGLPTYDTPERAVRAFWYMVQHARNLEMAKEIPPRISQQVHFDQDQARTVIAVREDQQPYFLTETKSKYVLKAYGIRVTETHTADSANAAIRMAEDLNYPVALKILSPDITHKTDAGGIKLNLRDSSEVAEAYESIITAAKAYKPDATIEGVAVQPYISRPDYELLIGLKRDAHFGPVILFGMGGIFTEVISDRALGLAPLNRLLVRRLMEETRVYKLLGGYRNRPPADMQALEDIILSLSQLAVDIPEIAELDMNPVMVKNGAPVAVDARILIAPSPKPSPLHLAISPYPAHQERHVTTNSGLQLLIRPIKPEDALTFAELFEILSPTSVYYRFFRYIKTLSNDMLVRLTQIDYDRETSLVALDESSTPERMLGVANIVDAPDGKKAEFAILIGDPWQGQGVGACLLEYLLSTAKQRGLQHVYGSVLRGNTQMLRLGNKVGFKASYNTEEEVYDLNIDLSDLRSAGTM
ncbi:MAG: bifunctional acetate--CoA ligase family protein/GNAT family N-acetyltransferase [Desulfobacterales bacterium]|nr:bifunctional acetate--CoA ligase family protein/GNAT family N-acetyltransferase [Desulfobacterales bacterium]